MSRLAAGTAGESSAGPMRHRPAGGHRLEAADLVQEVAAPQLALEDGRDGGVEVAFRLATDGRREVEPCGLVQRHALEVAHRLHAAVEMATVPRAA